ncbi:trehalose-phosphate synthase [Seminavis robusta]|uniref:Trehalose-phosphate synthase n=1 Tax=Seminavis robusta TaxID=568900 RepID=A0A9N8EGP4_9STRA|nr:trehalose-phosphate synthase [Seminavis robusta]|eukprot:Sro1165_g248100.1 trehalose-phosphate synthase (1216) ;mRNA; f:14953-18600
METESPSPTAAPPLNGRVVRLYFKCRAELPIGSYLRVTGCTLWAPGSSSQDPTDAHQIAKEEASQGFPVRDPDEEAAVDSNALEGVGGFDEEATGMPTTSSMYTSSVELVTTPEEYPIWRTRRPVVVVLHKQAKQIQHHYYRYLVVTPGATTETGALTMAELAAAEEDDDGDGIMDAGGAIVSTSEENMGSTRVMMWEDPFQSLQKSKGSGVSLDTTKSFITNDKLGVTKNTIINLPYRTVDIDVSTGTPILEEDARDVRVDTWNNRDDISFRPYLIRDAMNVENRKKTLHRRAASGQYSVTDVNMDDGTPSAGMDGSGSGPTSGGTTPVPPAPTRIFFVCFHLPVVVVQNQDTKEWRASWSESLMAKTEGSKVLSTYQGHWVGTVTTHPPITSEEDKAKVRAILAQMDCTPIFLDPAVRQAHYYGFCKQVLWPAMHNIDLLDLSASGLVGLSSHEASDWDQSRLDEWWTAYQDVNSNFANVVTSLIKPSDIVWIHDYHLSLLPMMMQAIELSKFNRTVARKVFFLHIPFPTSQIFRELECGEAILEGMLHADVVGFHAFDHARHFLNAAKRILGLNYESLVGGLIGVNFHGKTVLVTMSNVSIEPKQVDAALMLPSVQAGYSELQQKHKGRILICGVDIGQQLSGISLKLLAFERLLQDYPNWQSRVVMVQRVLLPNSRKADEAFTVRELHAVVKRIQDKFGQSVIDYQECSGSSYPMGQRLALWKASDVFISTPVREGLNHWPMEYIYTNKEPDVPGVVIASEFSAVCSILNGALRVNPYDIQMTITTIDKALSMELQERAGRRYRDIDFVSKSQSDKWVYNVLRDLKDAVSRSSTSSEGASSGATPIGGTTPMRRIGKSELVDTTAGFLARESIIAFPHLKIQNLKASYDVTTRRVIVLDFNGTIVLKEPPGKYLKREILGTSGNKPPPQVVDALACLCQDPRNTVFVVSGDSSENVINALGHIPRLGLAVSNGAKFSPPAQFGEPRHWKTFDLGVDWDAVKRVALPVLSKYTARSNGSFVKLTSFSIGWSYYSCDPEWGSLQASHLVLELESELRAFDVRFVTLKGIVEVVPRKLNKGLIVKKLLRDTGVQHPEGIDFILCFGDDISDEKMFTSVFSYIAEMGDEKNAKPSPPVLNEDGSVDTPMELSNECVVRNPLYSYTVAVGRKASHASTYVNDAQEVANALVLLAKGEVPSGGVAVWGAANSPDLFT